MYRMPPESNVHINHYYYWNWIKKKDLTKCFIFFRFSLHLWSCLTTDRGYFLLLELSYLSWKYKRYNIIKITEQNEWYITVSITCFMCITFNIYVFSHLLLDRFTYLLNLIESSAYDARQTSDDLKRYSNKTITRSLNERTDPRTFVLNPKKNRQKFSYQFLPPPICQTTGFLWP